MNNDITFSQGDYERQERQRKKVEGMARKVLSLNGVSNRSVLNSLETNMRTDMSFTDMRKIALDCRNAFGTIKQD